MIETRTRLLDAGLELLGEGGPRAVTTRAAEERAGVPHGSVRHHFLNRQRFLVELVDHAAAVEGAALNGADPAAAVRHWVGPGRSVALARFELALLAARNPDVRAAYLAARERFVQRAGGGPAGRRLVLAVDGLVLDALVRADVDAAHLMEELSALAQDTAPRGERKSPAELPAHPPVGGKPHTSA